MSERTCANCGWNDGSEHSSCFNDGCLSPLFRIPCHYKNGRNPGCNAPNGCINWTWYNEKIDGPDKQYIESMLSDWEIEPVPDEPGFYKVKGQSIVFDFSKKAKEAWSRVCAKKEASCARNNGG